MQQLTADYIAAAQVRKAAAAAGTFITNWSRLATHGRQRVSCQASRGGAVAAADYQCVQLGMSCGRVHRADASQ